MVILICSRPILKPKPEKVGLKRPIMATLFLW